MGRLIRVTETTFDWLPNVFLQAVIFSLNVLFISYFLYFPFVENTQPEF